MSAQRPVCPKGQGWVIYEYTLEARPQGSRSGRAAKIGCVRFLFSSCSGQAHPRATGACRQGDQV